MVGRDFSGATKVAPYAVCVALMATAYGRAAQGSPTATAPNPIDHAAIQYSSRPTSDAVAELNRKTQSGQARLAFEDKLGYLRSVLAALDVPVESQMLVYSPTSLQAEQIAEKTPRALYFSD